MATFMDMIQAMMAQGGGGPAPEAAPTPMPGNPGRPMPNPMGMNAPGAGIPERPFTRPQMRTQDNGEEGVDVATLLMLLQSALAARQNQPDAGDVYDYHNSNGDPGIMGLFGSNPPPLRQPPPGVNRRRGF